MAGVILSRSKYAGKTVLYYQYVNKYILTGRIMLLHILIIFI